jgi:hypothetical protein
MAYYIKARQIVHDALGFATGDRGKTKDGRYLLWQADMIKLGAKLDIAFSGQFYDYLLYVARRVGALVLTAKEAREEQDGTMQRELPIAEDSRFIDDEQRQKIILEQKAAAEAAANAEAETEETTDGEAVSNE